MINVDQYTLLRNRGKFSRVCLNIDITKSLPGSVKLDHFGKKVEAPLCYEGLHEICIFCGDGAHDLDNCSTRPSPRPFGMVVEKFGSSSNYPSIDTSVPHPTPPEDSSAEGKWVRVTPKRKTKLLPL